MKFTSGLALFMLEAMGTLAWGYPIIDTHIHIFDPSRPEGVPWPSPGSGLYRTTLPADYNLVGKPAGVTGVVIVEASDWLEDNQWVLDQIRDLPEFHGLIGNLPPGTDEFASHLERFSANPKFLGIRLRTTRVSRAGLTAPILRDLRALAAKDRVLEFQIQNGMSNSLDAAMAVAEQVPDLPIMLDHLANGRVTGNPPDPAWIAAIQAISKHPRVYCKVSGLVNQAEHRNRSLEDAYYKPLLDVLWEAFGPERLVYGSNWPVSEDPNGGRPGSFAGQQRLVMAYFQAKGTVAVENVMGKNAERFYRLAPSSTSSRPYRGERAAKSPGRPRPSYTLSGRFTAVPLCLPCVTREGYFPPASIRP